jgi:hypothetical protein
MACIATSRDLIKGVLKMKAEDQEVSENEK